MRKLGSMDALELMCDERGRVRDTSSLIAGLFDDHRSIEGTIMGGSRQKMVAKSRMMYYRVTGEAFEKVMGQSSSRNRRLLGSGQRDTAWDPDVNLGGDDVMGVWRDLKMSESRLDGHLDHASGLGYWEWTMKFKNEANIPREARMQILLPQHGVVSRLTLWVNGEPREAAFASTAKVAKAYKQVAVIQRRDPVLARWVGPDRVMVQCFPVPVNGEMKIRIGITAPVRSDGHWYLPRLIEQNYLIAEEMKTAVWVQGDSEFELDSLAGVGENGRWREVHGELSTRYLNQNYTYVRVLNRELPDRVWTIDPFALGEKKVLLAERTSNPKSDRDRPIVAVVDTSKGSEKWSQAIYDSLKAVSSQGREIQVVLAQDNGVEVLDSLDQLLLVDYWGGKDNQPALLKGFEIACKLKASDVIWFHADQPVRFEQSGALGQFVEHSLVKFTMSTVDIAGGVNRVLEDLGKEIRIASQERPNSSAEMVAQVKAMLNGEESRFHWEYVESEAQVGDATKVWDQLARWRVWRDVEHSEPDKSLVELASKYQLVTPVSGAVVLETEEQYKRNDLEAIDESMAPSIPAVPEPSTFWLLMLAGVGLLARRDRTMSL